MTDFEVVRSMDRAANAVDYVHAELGEIHETLRRIERLLKRKSKEKATRE